MSEDWTYKLGEIEGRISGIEERLNHIGARLEKIENRKVGKWEVRIWFITMMAFVSFWSSIFLHFIA